MCPATLLSLVLALVHRSALRSPRAASGHVATPTRTRRGCLPKPAAESAERRPRGRGERAPSKHAPGAGAGTGSREATEEGTVHRTLPPSQRRQLRTAFL